MLKNLHLIHKYVTQKFVLYLNVTAYFRIPKLFPNFIDSLATSDIYYALFIILGKSRQWYIEGDSRYLFVIFARLDFVPTGISDFLLRITCLLPKLAPKLLSDVYITINIENGKLPKTSRIFLRNFQADFLIYSTYYV